LRSRQRDVSLSSDLDLIATANVEESLKDWKSTYARDWRIVSQGSVWAPRRILSMFIERVSSPPRPVSADQVAFTDREKEVLKMLVRGQSNKEIGAPLGIRERTVKAHVAKLMRKVGVQNRFCAKGKCNDR
jgi:DNA-binding NarL/FixJ family response regulator